MKHEQYKNVTIMEHPLIIHKISKMRDEKTGCKEFREYVNEIAMLMGYEVTRDLPLHDVKIQTPIAVADAKEIDGHFHQCIAFHPKAHPSEPQTAQSYTMCHPTIDLHFPNRSSYF